LGGFGGDFIDFGRGCLVYVEKMVGNAINLRDTNITQTGSISLMTRFFGLISSFAFIPSFWRKLGLKPSSLKPFLGLVCVVAIALSGCVESDVSVHFDSPNRGEIVQHIQFSERLQNLSGSSLQEWTRTLERQAAAVGGKVQKVSPQAVEVKIGFTSSEELEQKFNQFFAIFNQAEFVGSRLPSITSELTIAHSNFLLLERDRLTYTIDLRSLGVVSTSGEVLVSPVSLIDLQFGLETPWGARSIANTNTLKPRSLKGNKKLIWTLIPGEENTLETVFWMPNPLGLGTVAIVLLIFVGRFFKYPQVEVVESDIRI